MIIYFKKIFTVILLFSLAFKAFCPDDRSFVIMDTPPEVPFNQLMHAIGMVETENDTVAYNPFEQAAGCFQIRPIRLEDYNLRTGSNYIQKDLFDYRVSEKIFLYYASQIGPYDLRKIALKWNGSGPQTLIYWNRVNKYL